MNDLSYSINVLQCSFMTWSKCHERYIVYPRSLKKDRIEPQTLVPEEVVRRLGRNVVEGVSGVYKVYQWGQEEEDVNRGYVWREWYMLHYCQSAYIYKPRGSQILLCYNKVREVGHVFPVYKSNLSLYIQHGLINDEKEMIRIAGQLVKAVCYLHERGIIHGDLKPENILMTEQNDVLLADLGSVRIEGISQYGMNCGTLPYQSPQRLKDGKCSKADDMWALGVIFWQMQNKRLPYPDHFDCVLDYRFFWAQGICVKGVTLSEICWKKEACVEKLMEHLQISWVTAGVHDYVTPQDTMMMMMMKKSNHNNNNNNNKTWEITREELGEVEGKEWIWKWVNKVQNGLHKRGATYNRNELIGYVKQCFEYIWLEGKVDPSILYHMLCISDDE